MAEAKEKKHQEKKPRVWSIKFFVSLLIMAMITFGVCFAVGMEFHDQLPF